MIKIPAAAVAVLFAGAASVLPLTAYAEDYDYTEGTYECLTYEKYEDHVSIAECDESAEGEIVIPAEIEGLPVTNIGNSAFYDCERITAVTLPDCLEIIEEDAFYGCLSLTEIRIPESVTSIESGAFLWCESLAEIAIPESVTSIGSYVFSNTQWVSDMMEKAPLVIVNNVLVEADWYNCEGDIVIPDGVTEITDFVFLDCHNITGITIPGSVTDIGRSVFSGCSGLTSVILPESVRSIGQRAFAECEGLMSITILNPDCEMDEFVIFNKHEFSDDRSEITAIFDGTIIGLENSTAQEYAEKYGYAFSLYDETERAMPITENDGVAAEDETTDAAGSEDDNGYKGFPVLPLAFSAAGAAIILVGVVSLAKKRKNN